MDVVEAGEEEASGSRVNSINIYCVCCSKQVESGTNLNNILCEHCISIMNEDDGPVQSSAEKELFPCKFCTKGFGRNYGARHTLCIECMNYVMQGCVTKPGFSIGPCRDCQTLFAQPIARQGNGICPQCQYGLGPKDVFKVYPRWADTVTLQGYTAVVAKALLYKYFYEWCEGHRAGNEAQEAHQCMEQSYATHALRRVCSHLCAHSIVKMIHAMQMSDEVKLGKGAARVVSKTLWSIFIADDPFLKMKEFRRGCPTCIRTHLERTAVKWGNRLCPGRSRDKYGSLRRRLFH